MSNADSIIHRVLVWALRYRCYRPINRIWTAAWRYTERNSTGPVSTTIHGYPIVMNFGYTYPLYARKFPALNNPLLELAYLTTRACGRPIVIVDVGAAIGDTAIFLRANCGAAIKRFICIDGDKEFLCYLRKNLSRFDDVIIVSTLLSEYAEEAPELVRTHSGTASSQGDSMASALTLDQALKDISDDIDLVKIDVDGFDGRVLAGARQVLSKYRPSVIFEWHPSLYKATHSVVKQPFTVLTECGYNRFIWFSKFGEFSHFTSSNDAHIEAMAEICMRNRLQDDWHYDVVGLHSTSNVDAIELAECTFARGDRSRF